MGEYIVQLDHEKPSHIIMPAIHKNAGQVASLFHDKLGVEYTKDVDQLIQIGRRVLRQKFFEADIGVSGAERRAHGRSAPGYTMLLGGYGGEEQVHFGERALRLPA